MDRRTFLRRAALIAAGVAAADQIDLLERLTHKKVWTGWTPAQTYVSKEFSLGFLITQEMIEDALTYQPGMLQKSSADYVRHVDSSLYALYKAQPSTPRLTCDPALLSPT